MTTLAERLVFELPVLAIAIPLAGALACMVFPRLARKVTALAGTGATLASAALALEVLAHGPRDYGLGGWAPPLGISLHVDGVAAALVLVASVVMTVCGLHARVPRSADTFGTSWLFALAALAVVFLSDDLFNVYVALELLGISAVALVAAPGNGAALTAALRYLAAGLIGSLLFLLGTALLYGSTGTLSMAALGDVSGLPAWASLAFMSAGLVLKSALFPLHGWLPGAHGTAPAPASAVLSGVVVKAGIYLLWRLWSDLFTEAAAGTAAASLGLLGAGALIWGGAMALRAERLKLVVAYSTVAQLGYLAIAIPVLRTGAIEALAGATLILSTHALAKAGCFLAVGAVLTRRRSDRLESLSGLVSSMPIAAFALALGAVSLVGLPPSGGFAGKWLLIQASLDASAWWWAMSLVAGSLLSAAVFVRALGGGFESETRTEVSARASGLEWTALALALGAVAMGPLSGSWLALVSAGSA